MKRPKRKDKRTTHQKPGGSVNSGAPPSPPPSPDPSNRRAFLRRVRNGVLVAAVAGGAGWYLVQDVSATLQEGDLSRIGNGIPTVVQIHDPQCPVCAALQRETRDAVADFEDGELQFLVANIRSAEGRRLAAAHGVGHVTLLLFDGEGNRRDVLVGSNTSEYLTQVFRRHLAKHRPS